jgi:hypothetical protein
VARNNDGSAFLNRADEFGEAIFGFGNADIHGLKVQPYFIAMSTPIQGAGMASASKPHTGFRERTVYRVWVRTVRQERPGNPRRGRQVC